MIATTTTLIILDRHAKKKGKEIAFSLDEGLEVGA